MGFLLTSCGLLVLYITVLAFKVVYGRHGDWTGLYEAITGAGSGQGVGGESSAAQSSA